MIPSDAPMISSSASTACGFSIFAITGIAASRALSAAFDVEDVLRRAHETQGQPVDTQRQAGFEVGAILLAERGGRQGAPGDVDPLSRLQQAAGAHHGLHTGPVDPGHLEFEQAVVEEEPVTRLHIRRKTLVGAGDPGGIAGEVPRFDDERGPRDEFGRFLHFADADLGATQVQQDRNGAAEFIGRGCGCAESSPRRSRARHGSR